MSQNSRERDLETVIAYMAPDFEFDVTYTHFENRSTFVAKVYEWDHEDYSHTQAEKDATPEITGTLEDGQVTFNVPTF